jgi:Fe2+ or Zn2+ uptake regulation protein
MGSSTTKEATKPRLIILKALEASDGLQNELKNLLKKLKNRNSNIENEFFIINWKLILSVS